jgi:hypothetical protein
VIGPGASGLTVLSNASVSVIDDEGNKNTVAAIWRHRRLKDVMRIKDAMDDPRLVAALQDTILTMSLKVKFHFFFKWLYQSRSVSSHIYLC